MSRPAFCPKFISFSLSIEDVLCRKRRGAVVCVPLLKKHKDYA
jgi:hypothetical protein